MRKITMFLLALFLFGFIGSSFIQVDASTTVSYEVTGVFESNISFGTTGSGTRGNTASFDLTSVPAGHDFVFWIVNGVVRRDLPEAYEHTLTTTNDLQIIYAPTGKYAVVFIDINNKYIDVEYTTGGTVLDSVLDMPVARPGFVVDSLDKWTSIVGSPTLADVQAHSVFVLNYEASGTPLAPVVITTVAGVGPAEPVAFNALVTVTAEPTSGSDTFVGWMEGSNVVSKQLEYTFTALYNRTLVATYAATPLAESSVVSLADALEIRTGFYSYVGQFELIEGQELIEYGFIYHESSDDVITLESAGIVVAQSSNSQTLTNEYVTSFQVGSHKSIRAYVLYKVGADVIAVYSENNVTYSSALQVSYIDFEDGTKDDYEAADVELNGESWNLDEALIGALPADRKFGAKSLRIRNIGGSISSNHYYENGIEVLRFHYGKFGTQANSTLKVQYSFAWSPDTWIDVMDGESPLVINVNSTDLQVALVNVNVIQAIHIRITKTSGGNPNIDNIIVNFDGYVDNVAPEIRGTQNFTITEGDDLTPLTGITAVDVIDGDRTAQLTFTVKDSLENIIDPVDFTTLTAEVYTVTYSVTDVAGNTGTNSVTLTVNAPSSSPSYLIDFEAYPSVNTYSGLKDFEDGLKMMYGNAVSSASPVYGSRHGLLRVARNTMNVAYIEYGNTTFDISSVTFQAKLSSTNNSIVTVQFSTNGTSWGSTITVSGLTTTYSVTPFEVNSNVVGARYFRVNISYTNQTSSNRDLLIDDILLKSSD